MQKNVNGELLTVVTVPRKVYPAPSEPIPTPSHSSLSRSPSLKALYAAWTERKVLLPPSTGGAYNTRMRTECNLQLRSPPRETYLAWSGHSNSG